MASRREQRRSLNNSLISGSISRHEYEELLPFVTSPPSTPSQHESASNATQRQPQPSVVAASTTPHSTSQRNVRFAHDVNPPPPEPPAQRRSDVTATTSPPGAFSAAEDGRVVVHNGTFSCIMQDTQVVATADGNTCEVYVMCCTWQPEGRSQPQATWYVSQRFSQFERLHKALKKKFARSSMVLLPPFPAKYHLTDRLEKRKQGLGMYMPRLLEVCTQLPNAQIMPELDEFLDISHQVQIFQSLRPSNFDPPIVSATPPVEPSSLFPASSGPAVLPSQPMAPPMDAMELAQAEGAIRLLASAVRDCRGDVRGNGTVQHHLGVCVQLAPGLQSSADVENPFADAELIPRAMQCQEDLQRAVALYNDALLAASGVLPSQQQVRGAESHVRTQQMPVGNVIPASAA